MCVIFIIFEKSISYLKKIENERSFIVVSSFLIFFFKLSVYECMCHLRVFDNKKMKIEERESDLLPNASRRYERRQFSNVDVVHTITSPLSDVLWNDHYLDQNQLLSSLAFCKFEFGKSLLSLSL